MISILQKKMFDIKARNITITSCGGMQELKILRVLTLLLKQIPTNTFNFKTFTTNITYLINRYVATEVNVATENIINICFFANVIFFKRSQ